MFNLTEVNINEIKLSSRITYKDKPLLVHISSCYMPFGINKEKEGGNRNIKFISTQLFNDFIVKLEERVKKENDEKYVPLLKQWKDRVLFLATIVEKPKYLIDGEIVSERAFLNASEYCPISLTLDIRYVWKKNNMCGITLIVKELKLNS